jgi:protein ImuB
MATQAETPLSGADDGPGMAPLHRLACLEVPSFRLQVLLRRHRDWEGHPAAVVDRDEPGGHLLELNEAARRARLLPGFRYAPALLLCRDLRAGVVSEGEMRTEDAALRTVLARHSPSVEPCPEVPGLFWLNASGLTPLHPSLQHWARALVTDLATARWRARVSVGFTRFGTLATVRFPDVSSCDAGTPAQPADPVQVFHDVATEDASARAVPLDRLPGLPHTVRDTLALLGVRTVADLLRLPPEEVLRRFGPPAHDLHRLASGIVPDGLSPVRPEEILRGETHLEYAEGDGARLLLLLDELLAPLLLRVRDGGRAVTGLAVELRLDDGTVRDERLRTAAPVDTAPPLLELLRLRIERLRTGRGTVGLALTLTTVPAVRTQGGLFAEHRARRDPAAAERGLARVRADLGDGAVVRARLREGHLPESRFTWEPLEPADAPTRTAPSPAPPLAAAGPPPLVRRILSRPQPLRSPSRHEPDGWMPGDLRQGAVERRHGPFVIAGGWWLGGVHREYHFLETATGEILWVFYDRPRRRWFLQGTVE